MKGKSIQITESLFKNPSKTFTFQSPQFHENMTVIPITISNNIDLEFITINQEEQLNSVEILETDSVSQLEVINSGQQSVLIPFGVTVKGGKQDRTIWEPILIPSGKKVMGTNPTNTAPINRYSVPAKCVEQSRWNYKAGKKFRSSTVRLHPNVAYEAISSHGQNAVWQEIQAHRSEMNYALHIAPTHSYVEMTKTIGGKTENYTNFFKNLPNQCGIAVFINGEFTGMEIYAKSNVWTDMREDILNAFAIEALRFQKEKVPIQPENYLEKLNLILKEVKLNFSVRDGIGLGEVVEFSSEDNKTRGITLIHEEVPIQFYFVSKRGGYKENNPVPLRMQTQNVIDQRYQI